MKGRVFKRCPCPTKRDANGRRVNCRKDHGSWSYVHDAPDLGDGVRRRQVMRGGFATSDLAQEALNAALVAVARGEYIETGTSVPTVAEYMGEWLANKRKLRNSTRLSYRQHIDNHIVPLLGRVKLTDLRAHHIDRMLTVLTTGDAKTGRKPVTVATSRRVFSTLRVALNSAVKKRQLVFSPCTGVELEPERREEAQVWNAAQVRAFLTAAGEDRLAVMYRLILTRGLRRGEAVGLRWRDVDLAAGVLRVRQAAVQVGRQLQMGPPKTKSGERVVSLDAGTGAKLRAHRKAQNEERLAWAGAYVDNDLVFAREDGSVERPDRVSRRFAVIAERAGLPVIKLHEGRHSAATLALEAGASMKEVQDMLGHSTYTLTADTYSHVSPAVRAEGAERVARLVDDPAAHNREQFVSSQTGTDGTVTPAASAAGALSLVRDMSGGRGIRTHEDGDTALTVFKSQEIVSADVDGCLNDEFQQAEGGTADDAVPPSAVSKHGFREQTVSNPPTS